MVRILVVEDDPTVHDASTGQRVLQWQATRPVNPASLTKLLTTMAALERLGPAWHWQTPVWISGPLRDGVLEGSVFILSLIHI